MKKRVGIHAHSWNALEHGPYLITVNEIKATLLDALRVKLPTLPAEAADGIDSVCVLAKISDVVAGNYKIISVQEAIMMCGRAGLKPRVVFD